MSKISDKQVMVVGLGYVGLPSAAVIADNGFNVIGYDINKLAVKKINNGEVHIAEEGLESLVKKVVNLNKLRATTIAEQADIFLITVPTPITREKKPDISYVESSVSAIAPFLKRGDLIILESTSPVGTTQKICDLIQSLRPDIKCPSKTNQSSDIFVAYSPERILPGQTIKELISNSRVVGGISEICTQKALSFYSTYVKGEIFATNSATAEMCKLAENSYRDVNLAFANELSILCENASIDVNEVIKYSNFHPRVNILEPGCGVGGHCIPIDPWFLVDTFGKKAQLIKKAREVNLHKTEWVVSKIKEKIDIYKSSKSDLKVCLLGLSYKPDSDDIRESPALKIAESIKTISNIKLFLVEPFIDKVPCSISEFDLISLETAFSECDIFFNLVNHSSFQKSEILLQNLPYEKF
jgi:UDP-N-acetyl-D-mannosaminuronic acid dehydrogenase